MQELGPQRGDKEKPYEVVIVGAGIVGSVMATVLGRAGRRVLLLEKSLSEPDRIVGELLQPAGRARLEMMGLGSKCS